jgi:aminopeptidase
MVIMNDPRIENLARILVHYSTQVKENDKVIIRGYPLEPIATPLIAEVYREVLKAGGHPQIAVDIPHRSLRKSTSVARSCLKAGG